MSRTQATIIYNPASGKRGRRADNVREMIRLLAERDIDARACATNGPHDAGRLAREAVERGSDLVISYGGDGTMNEVIQGLVGSGAALAVWPGGTANVLARELEMPSSIARIADIIAAGKTVRIALGVMRRDAETRRRGDAETNGAKLELAASSSDSPVAASPRLRVSASPIRSSPVAGSPRPPVSASPPPRYFIMFAGIGLDASVARSVSPSLKKRTGQLAFWVEGIKHVFTWAPEPFTIEVDGKKFEGVFALIGNGRGYGGGLCMTPHARLQDPCFEVYIVPRRSNNFAYLRDLAACARGTTARTTATLVRGLRVTANSSEEPWVEADGEIIGPLPMTFEIVPDALSVIVP
ncbi:MAG TPA: diacylglycerol kinase family protein [Blastocatellia bacterium]|nr:diacylglycerol kinase family protein [Blastocatellia bacterium]